MYPMSAASAAPAGTVIQIKLANNGHVMWLMSSFGTLKHAFRNGSRATKSTVVYKIVNLNKQRSKNEQRGIFLNFCVEEWQNIDLIIIIIIIIINNSS